MSELEDRLVEAFYAAYKASNITKKQGERFIYAFTGYMVASNPKQNTGGKENGQRNSGCMENDRQGTF